MSGYVYIVKADNYYKIGKARNPNGRISSFQTGNPFKIEHILSIEVDDYTRMERNLHLLFSEKHFSGEWFALEKEDVETAREYLSDPVKREEYNKKIIKPRITPRCDYCGKELDRRVFCSASHRVMYSRRKKRFIESTS